jgi:phosphoribosyl 1,2-cyclic phosphodiesterase
MTRPHTNPPFALTFWGVRGSIPTPVADNLGHGGNTACLSIDYGDSILILDAGSGIRPLGRQLLTRPTLPEIHLLFTHFHWDHIQGLPFFDPQYRPDARIILYSFHTPEDLRAILAGQMVAPYFPVDFQQVAHHLHFRQIQNTTATIADLTVQCFDLNHPQRSQGYRISNATHALVIATDHEHGDPDADARLSAIAQGADLLVYDAQYTPLEYEKRHGWGHSTWRDAVSVAREANIPQVILFHHDPAHNDATLDAILAEAQTEFPGTLAAREGMTLQLNPA